MSENKHAIGTNRVVSSEAEELILVDEQDNETGYLSKAACHDGDGVLHRAFSVFLFNDRGELLLQQRSPSKRLWGGYWSNSCCSHPRRGESIQVATRRRLRDVITGWFEPTTAGVYDIQCTEMCGIGHGIMGARIRTPATSVSKARS